eukprot:372556-Prorocentrum_minimum.AAC.1
MLLGFPGMLLGFPGMLMGFPGMLLGCPVVLVPDGAATCLVRQVRDEPVLGGAVPHHSGLRRYAAELPGRPHRVAQRHAGEEG